MILCLWQQEKWSYFVKLFYQRVRGSCQLKTTFDDKEKWSFVLSWSSEVKGKKGSLADEYSGTQNYNGAWLWTADPAANICAQSIDMTTNRSVLNMHNG